MALLEGPVVRPRTGTWDTSSMSIQNRKNPVTENTMTMSKKLQFLFWFRFSNILGYISNSVNRHAEGVAVCRRDP